MARANLLLTFILIIVMGACVPQQSAGKKRVKKSLGSSTATTPTPIFTPVNTNNLFWYSDLTQAKNITINSSTLKNVHLRGQDLETFLNKYDSTGLVRNYDRVFCIVADFSNQTIVASKQMRVRAMPVKVNNSQGEERMLRVEFPDSSNSKDMCKGAAGITIPADDGTPIYGYDFDIDTQVDLNESVFDPGQVCTNCNVIYGAGSVKLYYSDGAYLDTNTQQSLSGLSLNINPQDDTNNSGSTCNNSSCQALGFDCCLQGQCVDHGQSKPTALSLTSGDIGYSEYQQSQNELNTDPLAFLTYPAYYYICSNNVFLTPTPTATVDAEAAAQAELKEKAEHYLCSVCDATDGSDPTHANCTSSLTLAYGDTVSFSSGSCTYATSQLEIVTACGCESTVANCPGYSLNPVLNGSSAVASFACVNPTPDIDPTPFQMLNVPLEAQTAPHRYFKSDGTSVDDISTLASNVTDENDAFTYIDPNSKLQPQITPFSMSHIIGEFSLQLDKAIPAKVINVEFNETYVLSTIEGFFTPCQSCARDTWFNIFSSNPSSRDGKGLYPMGHTNSRNTASTNYTFGNYEDTVFGRACWLPPTMLPFSHQPNADLQTQRLNRLKTQAAFYVNGYQRDWFGFNKGAVIGSFDGVRWFAIGKGRKVTATSTKMFLAINAGFADLTSPSTMTLQIVKDTGISGESIYDHDPDLNWNDPNQTEAASCRRFHQCEVDSDCVTQLGWEYSCAQVTTSRTMWPKFDINGDEKVNDAQSFNLSQLLQGNVLPGSSLKRCVYRGRGALCNRAVASMSSNAYKENYTCAPNFYCADIAGSVFNEKVARFAGALEDIYIDPPMHQYGHDAYQLGRPYKYIGDSKSLPTDSVSNINYNAGTAQVAAANQFSGNAGICMPGRDNTSGNLGTQHLGTNAATSTDYVSQIGTCNSASTHSDTLTTVSRYIGCPSFASNGDYIMFKNDETIDSTSYNYVDSSLNYLTQGLKLVRSQNLCGMEAQDSGGLSAFSSIEANDLPTLTASGIITPMMPKNACMRRAGAICFTNLDCSPNELHSENAFNASDAKYGDNNAERSYWEESLICGQAEEIPLLGAFNFDTYDVKKNRCCREIGKDVTIYSKVHYKTGDESTISPGTQTSADPTATNRYSRYDVLPEFQTTTYPVPEVASDAMPAKWQWKTVGETANLTCCGGGYIRKFADGSHDWTLTDRLQIDISSFKCLNYANNLALYDYFDITIALPSVYYGDQDFMCHGVPDLSASTPDDEGGCAQSNFPVASSGIVNPAAYTSTTDTVGVFMTGANYDQTDFQSLDEFSPYFPRALPGYKQFIDIWGPNTSNLPETQLYLPYYIYDSADITAVSITNPASSNTASTCSMETTNYNSTTKTCSTLSPTNLCCYNVDMTTRVLTIATYLPVLSGASANFGITIDYNPTNTSTYASAETKHTYEATTPGNTLYYSTKLSRMEFLGIPQMMYEPVFCPSNTEYMIDGLYNYATRTLLDAAEVTDTEIFDLPAVPSPATHYDGTVFESMYSDLNGNPDTKGNLSRTVVSESVINKEPIFSSNEFTCCLELGKETLDKTRCCTNHAVNDSGDICDPSGDDTCYCKLPDATDLSVYFNPFVSSEWQRKDSVVEWEDDDFDPITGEIKLSSNGKLLTAGAAYCASGLTRGGSTSGYFFGEPIPPNGEYDTNSGEKLSIVDSYSDYDQSNGNRGAYFFLQGFRWDTHIYCNTAQ